MRQQRTAKSIRAQLRPALFASQRDVRLTWRDEEQSGLLLLPKLQELGDGGGGVASIVVVGVGDSGYSSAPIPTIPTSGNSYRHQIEPRRYSVPMLPWVVFLARSEASEGKTKGGRDGLGAKLDGNAAAARFVRKARTVRFPFALRCSFYPEQSIE
jgi:hypothetical protein